MDAAVPVLQEELGNLLHDVLVVEGVGLEPELFHCQRVRPTHVTLLPSLFICLLLVFVYFSSLYFHQDLLAHVLHRALPTLRLSRHALGSLQLTERPALLLHAPVQDALVPHLQIHHRQRDVLAPRSNLAAATERDVSRGAPWRLVGLGDDVGEGLAVVSRVDDVVRLDYDVVLGVHGRHHFEQVLLRFYLALRQQRSLPVTIVLGLVLVLESSVGVLSLGSVVHLAQLLLVYVLIRVVLLHHQVHQLLHLAWNVLLLDLRSLVRLLFLLRPHQLSQEVPLVLLHLVHVLVLVSFVLIRRSLLLLLVIEQSLVIEQLLLVEEVLLGLVPAGDLRVFVHGVHLHQFLLQLVPVLLRAREHVVVISIH